MSKHQFAIRKRPDSTVGGGDSAGLQGGGGYYLASALYVPTEMRARTLAITSLVDTSGAEVEIETATAHALLVDDEVWISDINSLLDGKKYVAATPTPTRVKVKATPTGGIILGDGSGGAPGTLRAGGVFSAGVALGSESLESSSFSSGFKTGVAVNGRYKSAWSPTRSGFVAAMFPTINIGTSGANTVTSGGKPIYHLPYVALADADDAEAKIAGALWHAVAIMRPSEFGSFDLLRDDADWFIVWMKNTNVLRLTEMALWLSAPLEV